MTVRPESVLIVDDTDDVCTQLEAALRSVDVGTSPRHRVRTVHDATSAFSQLARDEQSERPLWDLVILDINLGGDVTGLDVLDVLWTTNAAWAVAILTNVPQDPSDEGRALAAQLYATVNTRFPDSTRVQSFEKPSRDFDLKVAHILSFYGRAATYMNVFRPTGTGGMLQWEVRYSGSKARTIKATQGCKVLHHILRGETATLDFYETTKAEKPHEYAPRRSSGQIEREEFAAITGKIDVLKKRGIHFSQSDLRSAAQMVHDGLEPPADSNLARLKVVLGPRWANLPGVADVICGPSEASNEIEEEFASLENAERERRDRRVVSAPKAESDEERHASNSMPARRASAAGNKRENARSGISGWLSDIYRQLNDAGFPEMSSHLESQIATPRETSDGYKYPKNAATAVVWRTA